MSDCGDTHQNAVLPQHPKPLYQLPEFPTKSDDAGIKGGLVER